MRRREDCSPAGQGKAAFYTTEEGEAGCTEQTSDRILPLVLLLLLERALLIDSGIK